MESGFYPMSRHEELVVQELTGEVLIYDLKIDKAFSLNETSAEVWKLCDGTKSVGEITALISEKINSPVTQDLVWLALEQLKKENLLDNGDLLASRFKGVSRRELIKKVGLTTAIALPVISSLVAPTAAQAQSAGSCIPIGVACTVGGTPCCPGPTGSSGCFDIGFGPVCLST